MRLAFVLVVLAFAAGCQPSRSSVELKLGGSTFHLGYGRAIAEKDALVVELSDTEVACSQRDVPGDAPRLRMTLPPGRDAHFFAGKATGYPTKVSQGKTAIVVPHQLRTATLEPFEAKAGQRLRGRVDFDAKVQGKPVSAHGKLDVLLCEAPTPHKSPAPHKILRGRYAGKSMHFMSASAELGTDAHGKPFIDQLVFSSMPRQYCRTPVRKDSFVLDIRDIGGTAGGMPPKGQPLPAVASAWGGNTPMRGWVAFDEGSLRLGTLIGGELAVTSNPAQGGKFAGRFRARVCPEHFLHRVSASGNVTLSVNGKKRKLAHGRASLRHDGIWIKLAYGDQIPCSQVGTAFGRTRQDGGAVSFLVPFGPGNKFYAGQKTGVALHIASPSFHGSYAKRPVEARRDQAEVELKPVEPQEFAHVRGHLYSSFKHLSDEMGATPEAVTVDGDFDAELCTPVPGTLLGNAMRSDAPARPASGEFGSEPFHVKSAVAFVSHDKTNDTDFIQSVKFFGHPGAGCASAKPAFTLTSPGGADSGNLLSGTPQPTDIALPNDSAWIRFDKIDFKPGGHVQGSVVVASGPAAPVRTDIAGQFVAKVCKSAKRPVAVITSVPSR